MANLTGLWEVRPRGEYYTIYEAGNGSWHLARDEAGGILNFADHGIAASVVDVHNRAMNKLAAELRPEAEAAIQAGRRRQTGLARTGKGIAAESSALSAQTEGTQRTRRSSSWHRSRSGTTRRRPGLRKTSEAVRELWSLLRPTESR